MNQEVSLPLLALPRTAVVGENAFDGDKLGRRELAERLTGYIDRLREGAVLAIDAPWGEGKTWFGRNWAKHLVEQGHKVVFIDAFEQDYIEDPFLLITAEISQALDDGQGSAKGLREKAADVMKAILPVGTKALINLAGRIAIGSADLSGEIKEAAEAARDGATDVAGKWVEKKLENFAQEKESLQHFRTKLAEFAANQDKPVVLFIDELDRCRPDFAVKLVERLKHFFDVPNLVFILLLNREQLELAVKGVYGEKTKSSIYLNKFVNFFFRLPKRTSLGLIANDHINTYVSHVFNRYNFTNPEDRKGFTDMLSLMAKVFNLSLRDIERAMALYAFAQPVQRSFQLYGYLIPIKIADPKLCMRLSEGEISAHEEAKVKIDDLITKLTVPGRGAPHYLHIISELHAAHINGFNEIGATLTNFCGGFFSYDMEIKQLIPLMIARIDLSIES